MEGPQILLFLSSPTRTSLLAAVLVGACRTPPGQAPGPTFGGDKCPRPEWAAAPLQPQLLFDEPGPAGVLTILLLDRHSGEPIPGVVGLAGTTFRAYADPGGIARLSPVPPGRYLVVAMAISFHSRRDSVVLASNTGRTRVVQLQRSPYCLETASFRTH